MQQVLEENKGYEHAETKRLLEEIREFFQGELRQVVSECTSVRANAAKREAGDPVEAFLLEKSSEPIYESCSGGDDLDRVLNLFEQELNKLLDHFDELLDKNDGLDDESRKNLDCYARAVEKCINVYGTQRRKRMARFKELETVAEVRDELRLLFSEIISNYIIAALYDGLYERIKNGSGQIYGMVIREVNGFLGQVGVYTKPIAPGEPIDPELMEPTHDSAENFTDDFRKFDTVDQVCRYPYLFADGAKVMDGRVRIWRRKD